MQQMNLLITNPSGLHTRPATELARLLRKYKSKVFLEYENQKIPAKSALNIIAACIGPGSEITVTVEGEDESECLSVVEAYVKELTE